jgi:class 3 adenylate cyclase
MADRPTGILTFLFTDIQGSTSRWEEQEDAMRAALARHDQVLRAAIEAHGGRLFKHTGDGMLAAFGSPSRAVEAASRRSAGSISPCGWRSLLARRSCATTTTSAPR